MSEEIPQITVNIPPLILKGLRLYAQEHQPVGHFLTAFLSNDLMEAVGRADNDSLRAFKHIAQYVHNCMPSNCHGSLRKVKEWLEKEPSASYLQSEIN